MHSEVRNFQRICCGNASAVSFLCMWMQFIHSIDDLVDEPEKNKQHIIDTFAMSVNLFNHPFYLENHVRLFPVVMLVANAYADSVAFEDSKEKSKQDIGNVLRFAGNELIFAVALICGGYFHLRQISAEMRLASWEYHHDDSGKPI